jgi:integrase
MGKDLKGKELGKGISQRKDGRYQARFDDRFGKRRCLYASTVKEVKAALEQAVFENRANLNVRDEGLTVRAWFKTWFDTYKALGIVSPGTRLVYKGVYERYVDPVIGGCRVSEVKAVQIRGMINSISRKGYSFEIQHKALLVVKDMFDKAVLDEYALKNPASRIKIERDEEKEPKALSKEEEEAFFVCAAGTFYYNLFVVAVLSGLRPGELFALTEKDLDFENDVITVSKTLVYQKYEGDEKKEFHVGPPKTRSSNRKVPMSERCREALENQVVLSKLTKQRNRKRQRFEDNDFLFVTTVGTPINAQIYSEAIRRILYEINLQRESVEQIEVFSGHAFRHTFATRCFEAGIKPKTIQAYLGHASLQTTMDLYVHVMSQYSMDEIEKLDGNFVNGVKMVSSEVNSGVKELRNDEGDEDA